jgi:nucleoside-triphosphatase
MIKNIFITGLPGCGKTTLIMEILKELNFGAGGFYTSEIKEGGRRLGFTIKTLNGQEGVLAHVNIKSPFRVSKYKVNIKDLEDIGVKSILDSLRENKMIVIDEVGAMEMKSEEFKKAVETALNSKNKVLGTIKLIPDPFTNKIKKRKNVKILYLTRENREKVKEKIISFLESRQ